MADFRKNNKDDDDGFIEKLVNIRRGTLFIAFLALSIAF
jgi:hypothetical protein